MRIDVKYFNALNGEDMGISNTAMLCAFIGITNESRWGNETPCDPSDFGRCYRLLKRFPEFKDQMHKLNKFENWKPMVKNWEKMTEIYLRDLDSGKSSELFDLMQELNSNSKV